MNAIFYTTGCPKCEVLKKKLDAKNIQYEVCTDTTTMLNKGLTSAPALEIDGNIMTYKDAIKFLNNWEGIL